MSTFTHTLTKTCQVIKKFFNVSVTNSGKEQHIFCGKAILRFQAIVLYILCTEDKIKHHKQNTRYTFTNFHM